MLKTTIQELFYAITAALFIFIIMEIIKPDMVQAYLSVNILLLLWLINGMVLLVINNKS